MSAIAATRGWLRQWSWLLFPLSVCTLVWLALWPLPLDTKLVQKCDAVVETILTTHDPIELQRAGILVRALDCDVRRRVLER